MSDRQLATFEIRVSPLVGWGEHQKLRDQIHAWALGFLDGAGIEGEVTCTLADKHGRTPEIATTEEEWRPIAHLPGYEVSSHGRVRKLVWGRLKILKQGRSREYLSIRAGTRSYTVHRLVMETFGGPPPEPDSQVCHNNGMPRDNRIENLRWGSPKENAADRATHGTDGSGERNPRASLTNAQARAIYVDPRPIRAIARAQGVSRYVVWHIKNDLSWRRVNEDLRREKTDKRGEVA